MSERFPPPMSPASQPFWEATRKRQLVLQWCRSCEVPVHYPREACPTCLGTELEFRPASGRGVVYACSVMHRPGHPTLANRVPYVVALIDLDEGVRMLSNVTGCPPAGGDGRHVRPDRLGGAAGRASAPAFRTTRTGELGMDLRYTQEYEEYREEVKRFLAEHWPIRGEEAKLPPGAQAAIFRGRAIENGYYARSVPTRYGGSEQPPDPLKAAIISEEFARHRAPPEAVGLGPNLLVPTLLDHGAEWQKERFIPPIMRGEVVWCQGYSEPGAGSDLAAVQTKAELVGEEWVINGQKIWTSGAQIADYMFCLCRTEPDQPKHAGISYILFDMKQEGVEVQPLRQMTGDSAFNQVFFRDVRTPADWIVGKRGEGWIVSRSTLKHERNMIGNAARTRQSFESLVRLATRTLRNGRPAIEDPDIRQRLALLEGYVASHHFSGYRQLTCAARGQHPGIIQSMNKLVGTNIGHEVSKLALDLIGDDGLLAPAGGARRRRESPDRNRTWVTSYMGSLGSAIAGGTANIQRNIIAERGLGLPRDRAAQVSH